MLRLALPALATAFASTVLQASPPVIRSKSGNPELETLILPGAWSVMRTDQQREEAIILREAEEFMAKIKRKHLSALRTERDRAVARALAAAAVRQPFSPPVRATASLSDRSVETPHSVVSAASPTEPQKPSPGFVSRMLDHTADTARDVVSQAGDIAASVERRASSHSSPGGYYALALIAIFLVPSIGLAAIFWGITHLRHWSFFSGAAWIVIGTVMLWLAFSGAKMLLPVVSERPNSSVLAAP
jgi:hypothetical protein